MAPSFDQVGKEKDSQQVRVDVEYVQDAFAVALGVDVVHNKPTALLSAVGSRDHVTVGGEAAYSLGSAPDLQSLAVALGYSGSNWSATLLRKAAEGATQKVSYGANLYQKVDENLELGAEVAHAATDKAVPTLLFGGKFTGNKSYLKAKVGTNGRVGVAYTQVPNVIVLCLFVFVCIHSCCFLSLQDVNYFSSVTLGADVSTADSKDHKLGFAVNIHD